MKAIIVISAVLLITLFIGCQGQQVMVTGRAYFTDINGGSGAVVCRPSEDMAANYVIKGPTQRTCGYYSYPVPPASQGRWGGVTSPYNQKSGMGFTPIKAEIVSLDQDFYFGQLTHFNFPITDAASGIVLNIILNVSDASGVNIIAETTYRFNLIIDETPNARPNGNPTYVCPYPGLVNCSDKITFQNSLNVNQSFTLGEVEYTLRLIGFKESASSGSSAVSYFISNEAGTSTAYLYARITAACPKSCQGGGKVVIVNDECKCDCSTRNPPCPAGSINSPDCTCICPDYGKCKNNGSVSINNGCNCICKNCTQPKVLNTVDCGCSCPTDYCGAGSIADQNTCSCNCASLAQCPIANEVRDSRCACKCQLSCPANKVENPDTRRCECICSASCQAGYTQNPSTCQCSCAKTCPNGQTLDLVACQCTDCSSSGNWTKNSTTGLCTVCPLSQASCGVGQTFSARDCKCVCDAIASVCNLYNNGTVVDLGAPCACRPCKAGECICGNGRLEPGEECDTGSVSTPCCELCKLTTNPCDDGNNCTIQDSCDGTTNMTCRGDYKCPRSTECGSIYCNATIGKCELLPYADNTPCGNGKIGDAVNLCLGRCKAGVCDNTETLCAADNDTTDCLLPKCEPSTGICSPVVSTYANCSDFNGCTINDRCLANGTCTGTPLNCPPSTNPCASVQCKFGQCVPVPKSGQACSDGNECTIGDICVGDVCFPGEPVECNKNTDVCNSGRCDPASGQCIIEPRPDTDNITCDDTYFCTKDDRCTNGTCVGVTDPALAGTIDCGYVPPGAGSQLAIILSVAGAAALIGAIAGLAFLIKKIRDSKILSPDSWNPDTFSSIGANPLYKGNQKVVDNRLFDN